MRKEILPEMFNYNKYPGPDFVYVADLLKSDAYQFTVLENHKDALDATRFGQRFSEIMLKYDYIVGDWSNDQLALRDFTRTIVPIRVRQIVLADCQSIYANTVPLVVPTLF